LFLEKNSAGEPNFFGAKRKKRGRFFASSPAANLAGVIEEVHENFRKVLKLTVDFNAFFVFGGAWAFGD
jgi:hypothetical protein